MKKCNVTNFKSVSRQKSVAGELAVSVTMNTLMEPAGKACAETQQYRAEWLRIEVVLFWLCFVFFSWPIIALRCCSKESHDYILSKKEDSDDDD